LQNLYDGKIFPAEQTFPKVAGYKKALEAYDHQYNLFTKALSETEPAFADQFQKIMEARVDIFSMEISAAFTDGFRLGSKIIMEILDDEFCAE